MIEEIYPMPSFPMLIVKDLEVSAKWYQDVLGFKYIFIMPGPGPDARPTLVHLRWVKYADLRALRRQRFTGAKRPGCLFELQHDEPV